MPAITFLGGDCGGFIVCVSHGDAKWYGSDRAGQQCDSASCERVCAPLHLRVLVYRQNNVTLT